MVFGHFGPFQADMDSFEASMRAVTVGGIVLIGVLLCCLIICLVTMVASLTFSCWWTLGSFFKIGPTGVVQKQHSFFSSRQKLLRHKSSGNGTNAKCQLKKLSSAPIWVHPPPPASQPSTPAQQNQQNGQPPSTAKTQRVLLNNELEAVTAIV